MPRIVHLLLLFCRQVAPVGSQWIIHRCCIKDLRYIKPFFIFIINCTFISECIVTNKKLPAKTERYGQNNLDKDPLGRSSYVYAMWHLLSSAYMQTAERSKTNSTICIITLYIMVVNNFLLLLCNFNYV